MGRLLLIFAPLVGSIEALTAAPPPRHYSYSGNDPAQWTSTVIPARYATAATANFTVFPCNSSQCSIGRVIVDAAGNTYVVGSRSFQIQQGSGSVQVSDVFVAKLDPAGATIFLVTLGGKGIDAGRAIALDAAGNMFIGGSTTSPNFPLRNALQTRPGVGATAFLVKLSPDGGQLLYSSYFGGTASMSSVTSIAVDTSGNLWTTGQTGSRDFPITPGMPAGLVSGLAPGGVIGTFVAKISASGDRILSSGIISGTAVACTGGSSCFLSTRNIAPTALALDAAGNAYVAGNANVTDLPTTEGVLVRQGLGGWAARINGSAPKIDYLTYIGATRYGSGTFVSAADAVYGLTVDRAGNAYLAGSTNDPKFPVTPGAFQTAYSGPADPPNLGTGPPTDAFVAKLNPQGTAFVYATFLGGSGNDSATGIALDSSGSMYLTGATQSADFPTTTNLSAGHDFIAVLNPGGSALSYSARYPDGSVTQSLAVDSGGRVRAASPTGVVSSFILNATPATMLLGIASAAGGSLGPAVAPGEVISLFGTQLGPMNGVVATAGGSGKMPTTLGGTQVLFDGIAAPLLYADGSQINAVSPFGLTPGKATTVRILTASGPAPDFPGIVIPSRLSIFRSGAAAAALNEDGTINSPSNPAKIGSVMAVWATGAGAVYPVPAEGQVATAAWDYQCCQLHVFDKPLQIVYGGVAPGMVAGVVQINFRVGTDIPVGGEGQVYVTASPVSAAVIYVTP